MIAATTGAKVYYLPSAEPVLDTPMSRRVGLRRRLLLTWWRLRLSLADVRIGSWRLRRRWHHDDDYATLLDEVLGESPAQLIERRRPKPSRPATILDFEAARLRLRAQTS